MNNGPQIHVRQDVCCRLDTVTRRTRKCICKRARQGTPIKQASPNPALRVRQEQRLETSDLVERLQVLSAQWRVRRPGLLESVQASNVTPEFVRKAFIV